MTFGQRLRELRTEKGLKLKDVAAQLNINIMTYTHYELDDREPSLETLRNLCRFFEVSADYLIGLSDYY